MFRFILAIMAAFGGLVGAMYVTGNVLAGGIAAGAAFIGVLVA